MLSRQLDSINAIIEQAPNMPSFVKAIEMQKGYVDVLHQHCWHQLIFPLQGLLQTEADGALFLVPHTTALFVPAGVIHESVAITDTCFIGVHLNPMYGRDYGAMIKPVAMSAFLRELVLTLRKQCAFNTPINVEPMVQAPILRLLEVLYDQINSAGGQTFKLLIPKDRRLKLIFEHLTQTPALDFSLVKWGERVGASERTLSRLFVREFGSSFVLWRQHLRLIYSLSLLATDLSIQNVAHQIGYKNDSSYIKAFKERFGMTPQRFRLGDHGI
ncbi:AraC family transcriptional regulator [Shewanella baltica]|uniref:AraC family transcriptional regulator n=1 Tax=Shewanella baltica TaxID=62322 RepID=UPI002877EDDB|nr:helix-turn-helix transcriptional regulator [Shewanella baltica]MCS6238725.1 AraC family transcriptional regulator [Shewanella baltica]